MMRALAVGMLLALGDCGAALAPGPAAFAEFYADENVTGEVSAAVARTSPVEVANGNNYTPARKSPPPAE